MAKERQNRRDRRKAKASGWRREGTKNPKKVGHHMSFSTGVPANRPIKPKKKPEPEKSPEEKWKEYGQCPDLMCNELMKEMDLKCGNCGYREEDECLLLGGKVQMHGLCDGWIEEGEANGQESS